MGGGRENSAGGDRIGPLSGRSHWGPHLSPPPNVQDRAPPLSGAGGSGGEGVGARALRDPLTLPMATPPAPTGGLGVPSELGGVGGVPQCPLGVTAPAGGLGVPWVLWVALGVTQRCPSVSLECCGAHGCPLMCPGCHSTRKWPRCPLGGGGGSLGVPWVLRVALHLSWVLSVSPGCSGAHGCPPVSPGCHSTHRCPLCPLDASSVLWVLGEPGCPLESPHVPRVPPMSPSVPWVLRDPWVSPPCPLGVTAPIGAL